VRAIEKGEVEELKEILLSIARAKGSEAIEWSAKTARGERAEISAELSCAISSLKAKPGKDGCEYDGEGGIFHAADIYFSVKRVSAVNNYLIHILRHGGYLLTP
jgi:hypothetical protein